MAKMFHKRWDEAEAKAKEAKAAMRLEIAAVEKKITQLLDRIVDSDSATVIGAYERKVDELERQKLVLAEKTARCGTAIKGYDETFRTAFEFLSNPWNLWEKGTFEDKRIVLKLTLASHLDYDWNEGVRTPEISLPFRLLGSVGDRESLMADGVGFEPTKGLHPCRFSRPVHSTALPPVLNSLNGLSEQAFVAGRCSYDRSCSLMKAFFAYQASR